MPGSVQARKMERSGARISLHQQIAGALQRAARAQEDSRALVAECRRASVVLRDTIDATHRSRDARAGASRPPPGA